MVGECVARRIYGLASGIGSIHPEGSSDEVIQLLSVLELSGGHGRVI